MKKKKNESGDGAIIRGLILGGLLLFCASQMDGGWHKWVATGLGVLFIVGGFVSVSLRENKSGKATQQTKKENATETSAQDKKISRPSVPVTDEDFEFTEYLYEGWANSTYFIVVKNNATIPVWIHGTAVGKVSTGETTGEVFRDLYFLGAGETNLLEFDFRGFKNVSSVEYKMEYYKSHYRTSGLENLSVEQTINENDIILAVTNNSSRTLDSIVATVLFFDANNNLVRADHGFVMDNNFKIQPGKTEVKKVDTNCGLGYCSFDHCEVYFPLHP